MNTPQNRQDDTDYTRELKTVIQGWGGDLAGIADADPLKALPLDPPDLLDPFKTCVSVAVHLPWATFGQIREVPTKLYENIYQTANRMLDELAFRVARYLEADGFYSIPIPASQIIDEKNWTGAISHKAVARMAGIGWQGKNLLLITPEYGSAVRLVTILTDAPLTVDGPVKNRCGTCTRCREACPAGAIKGVNTDSHYERRNDAVDLDKCVARLMEHSVMLETYSKQGEAEGHRLDYHQLICGLCIKACPFGKKSKPRSMQTA